MNSIYSHIFIQWHQINQYSKTELSLKVKIDLIRDSNANGKISLQLAEWFDIGPSGPIVVPSRDIM